MTVQLTGPEANLPDVRFSRFGDGAERRSMPRIELPFPATVRGVDRHGERFRLETVLDNLSAKGLYLRIARPVEPGATLFIVVRLAASLDQWTIGPGVAARGSVLRADLRPGGVCGLAVAFRRHRFLYASVS